MNEPVTVPAPAKINLCLHVTGRRADGYHTLESLMAFVGLADRITAAPAAAGSFTLDIDGPFAPAIAGASEDNLVLRAARALAGAAGTDRGAALRLTKVIPVAAGLGGGSSDAAAALLALVRLWGLADTMATTGAALGRLALSLGADVPVCLAARPARVGGIGEVLAPVAPLPPPSACGVLLVNPAIGVETRAVFAAYDRAGATPGPAMEVPVGPFADAAALAAALHPCRNDLGAAACVIAPDIAHVIAAIGASKGCRLARMSGSGATCFGLFDSADTAALAARAIAAARPEWWTWSGGFAGR